MISLPHGSAERNRLAAYCKQWGGQLVRVPVRVYDVSYGDVREDDWYSAPFTGERLGLLWEAKKVIYSEDVRWPGILHEMGHVFAATAPPGSCEEYDFFGWEHVLAHEVGDIDEWYEDNRLYGVEDSQELYELDPDVRDDLMRRREEAAVILGLISSSGVPLAIR